MCVKHWSGWHRRQGEDVSLFYFAGHGTNDGVNTYICCYDSRNQDYSGDLVDYELVEMLESVRGQKIVMIDSCHSGGLLYTRSKQSGVARVKSGTPPEELEAGITEKIGALAIEGYEVMTACAVNEVAWGYPELEHGVFTHFLLERSGILARITMGTRNNHQRALRLCCTKDDGLLRGTPPVVGRSL